MLIKGLGSRKCQRYPFEILGTPSLELLILGSSGNTSLADIKQSSRLLHRSVKGSGVGDVYLESRSYNRARCLLSYNRATYFSALAGGEIPDDTVLSRRLDSSETFLKVVDEISLD